jgi:transcription initiation factor TFIIH subunit 2
VDLPCSCHVCGLTLVSSPHLARSYHHLFPVKAFSEVLPAQLEGMQARFSPLSKAFSWHLSS